MSGNDNHSPRGWGWSEDWLAVAAGWSLLLVSLLAIYEVEPATTATDVSRPPGAGQVASRLAGLAATPGGWLNSPVEGLLAKDGSSLVPSIARALMVSLVLFGAAVRLGGGKFRQFAPAFVFLFLLATAAYLLAGQKLIKSWNLEYALWALLLGLLISNLSGTPGWLRPAMRTELYIKTGLVLLGAEILLGKLVALGVPGVFVAWVVTPIVLVTTYWFGQRVLKIESRSLNMVISADMSVCGVSAAIASAAACRASKEELSVAIGISLSFTVVMMVVMPMVIRALGIDDVLGGAWMGGTIDATGAVAAAGALLGDDALQVATTIKMIQNILIGVIAFGIAAYWVTCVEVESGGAGPRWSEIWVRFPKFVVGFIAASVVFSAISHYLPRGEEIVATSVAEVTKCFRNWFFCLAFVSIGLESNFRAMARQLAGGKPLVLYVAGQSLNLCLTLAMAWLMFHVVFPDAARGLQP